MNIGESLITGKANQSEAVIAKVASDKAIIAAQEKLLAGLNALAASAVRAAEATAKADPNHPSRTGSQIARATN